jgi:hypothetical protein
MTDDFIADPTALFEARLQADSAVRADFGYENGRLSMALEIMTAIKALDAIPSALLYKPEETISTLLTLLEGVGLLDRTTVVYHELCEWRRPRFVRAVIPGLAQATDPIEERASWQPTNGSVGADVQLDLLSALASEDEAPGGELLRLGRTDALPVVHRSPREATISELAEWTDE